MAQPLHMDAPLAGQLERLGMEFLANFYAAEVGRHPQNLEALSELAHLYTLLGRYEEGLEADERLVRAMPDNPVVVYNHACSLCLAARFLESLDTLEQAIDLGYDDVEHLLEDEDLAALRHEPRFERLVRRLHSNAE